MVVRVSLIDPEVSLMDFHVDLALSDMVYYEKRFALSLKALIAPVVVGPFTILLASPATYPMFNPTFFTVFFKSYEISYLSIV